MATAPAAADGAEKNVAAEPIVALTRPVSTIEIGVGTIDQGAFAARSYDGLEREGGFLIGNFDLRGSQYSYGNDTDDRTRWRLTGTDLGLSSRSLTAEYGQQGAYRITFGYDQIRRLYSDSYQTPFVGAGSANLTLPAGFVRAADTGAMSTLAASMRSFDLETTRQRFELGLSYWLTQDWEFKLSFRNDNHDGSKLRGVEFGSNGGNPRTVLIPEPLDSSTKLVDASIAFSGEFSRFVLSYHGSFFSNHIDSVTLQNPYTSAPWVGGASGLPIGFPLPNGRIGVAPDNQFHQLSASGSYDYSTRTRLTLTASHGRMKQDQTFLPYTINPGLTSFALPRTSLDGLVETTFLNAKLSMRPVRNLSVHASLRYDNRENKTPQSEYIYIGGDIQLQPPPASDTDRIRTNLPRSRRQEQFTLDADYRLAPATAIKVGFDRADVKRTFAEVEHTSEDTYLVELRHGGSGPWSVTASQAWLKRRGSEYLHNVSFLASYTSPAFVSGLVAANGCMDLIRCIRIGPLQNKFYLADRDRERSRLTVGFIPDAPISVQARADWNRDRYPNSPYGVTEAPGWSVGADLGYVLGNALSATLFYTFEDQRSSERSRQITSPIAAAPSSPASDWVNHLVDKTSSIGVGMKYKGLLGGRLELAADAIAVRGRTEISTTVGPGVPPAQNPATPLPDLTVRSANFILTARYAVDRHSGIRFYYGYYWLKSTDWALEQVDVATLANVIGTRELPAHYSVHALGISYVRSFR